MCVFKIEEKMVHLQVRRNGTDTRQYRRHGRGILVCAVLALTLMAFSAGCISQPLQTHSLEEEYADQLAVAENLTRAVGVSVTMANLALQDAAKTIAEDPTNETLVHQVFGSLYLKYTSVKALMIVDTEKRITLVEPTANPFMSSLLNVTIEDPHFTYSANSPPLTLVDWTYGFNVTTAILPMVTGDGTYAGILIVALDPSLYYESLVHSYEPAEKYDVWIVDEAGYVIHSPEHDLKSENIHDIHTPDQTELARVLEKILSTKSGVETYAAYSYGALSVVTRVAAWDTVSPTAERNISGPTVIVTSDVGTTQQVSYPTRSTDLKLEEFVREAYLFAKKTGKEAALAEFSKQDGQFTTKEYYTVAFDMNGTLLANPFYPQGIGMNWMLEEDENGVAAVLAYTFRAGQGGGYITHVHENPEHNLNVEVMLSYIQPIDETWYIAAGEYHPELNAVVPAGKRLEMLKYAREITAFITTEGWEPALAAMNNGSYYRDDIELSIYDFAGNSIYHDPEPWSTGNLLGVTDIYGASIGRGTIALARIGGGFGYINLPSESHGTTQLSLKYMQPIGDDRFILLTIPMNT